MLEISSDSKIIKESYAGWASIVAGVNSCEHYNNNNIDTNNARTYERRRVISVRTTHNIISIEDDITYQNALAIVVQHHGVPIEREGDFAQAIHALAEDACLPAPRLLPAVLGGTVPERPGTVVTKAATFHALDFPKTAPEKWVPPGKGHKYQDGDETPEDFAFRVYGKWMRPDAPHLSIGMPEILNLDEPLWNALRRSVRSKKPEGFLLPSKKERGDALVGMIVSGSVPVPEDYKSRSRLVGLAGIRGIKLIER